MLSEKRYITVKTLALKFCIFFETANFARILCIFELKEVKILYIYIQLSDWYIKVYYFCLDTFNINLYFDANESSVVLPQLFVNVLEKCYLEMK